MSAETPRRPYHRHIEGPDARRCPRCGEVKPIATFTLPSGRVQGHCRECRLAVTQEWRARHHDELLQRRRASYPKADPTRSYGARNRQGTR